MAGSAIEVMSKAVDDSLSRLPSREIESKSFMPVSFKCQEDEHIQAGSRVMFFSRVYFLHLQNTK